MALVASTERSLLVDFRRALFHQSGVPESPSGHGLKGFLRISLAANWVQEGTMLQYFTTVTN
jgi:hypothetical protein